MEDDTKLRKVVLKFQNELAEYICGLPKDNPLFDRNQPIGIDQFMDYLKVCGVQVQPRLVKQLALSLPPSGIPDRIHVLEWIESHIRTKLPPSRRSFYPEEFQEQKSAHESKIFLLRILKDECDKQKYSLFALLQGEDPRGSGLITKAGFLKIIAQLNGGIRIRGDKPLDLHAALKISFGESSHAPYPAWYRQACPVKLPKDLEDFQPQHTSASLAKIRTDAVENHKRKSAEELAEEEKRRANKIYEVPELKDAADVNSLFQTNKTQWKQTVRNTRERSKSPGGVGSDLSMRTKKPSRPQMPSQSQSRPLSVTGRRVIGGKTYVRREHGTSAPVGHDPHIQDATSKMSLTNVTAILNDIIDSVCDQGFAAKRAALQQDTFLQRPVQKSVLFAEHAFDSAFLAPRWSSTTGLLPSRARLSLVDGPGVIRSIDVLTGSELPSIPILGHASSPANPDTGGVGANLPGGRIKPNGVSLMTNPHAVESSDEEAWSPKRGKGPGHSRAATRSRQMRAKLYQAFGSAAGPRTIPKTPTTVIGLAFEEGSRRMMVLRDDFELQAWALSGSPEESEEPLTRRRLTAHPVVAQAARHFHLRALDKWNAPRQMIRVLEMPYRAVLIDLSFYGGYMLMVHADSFATLRLYRIGRMNLFSQDNDFNHQNFNTEMNMGGGALYQQLSGGDVFNGLEFVGTAGLWHRFAACERVHPVRALLGHKAASILANTFGGNQAANNSANDNGSSMGGSSWGGGGPASSLNRSSTLSGASSFRKTALSEGSLTGVLEEPFFVDVLLSIGLNPSVARKAAEFCQIVRDPAFDDVFFEQELLENGNDVKNSNTHVNKNQNDLKHNTINDNINEESFNNFNMKNDISSNTPNSPTIKSPPPVADRRRLLCSYRRLCVLVDALLYPSSHHDISACLASVTPAGDQGTASVAIARQILDALVTLHACDSLYDTAVCEHRGLLFASVLGQPSSVIVMRLDSGRVLRKIDHQASKCEPPPTVEQIHMHALAPPRRMQHQRQFVACFPPSVLFVPQQDCLITAGRNPGDGFISVWSFLSSLPSSSPVQTFRDPSIHPGLATLSLSYLPTSQCIISSHPDGLVRVWDPVAEAYPLVDAANLKHFKKFTCIPETLDPEFAKDGSSAPSLELRVSSVTGISRGQSRLHSAMLDDPVLIKPEENVVDGTGKPIKLRARRNKYPVMRPGGGGSQTLPILLGSDDMSRATFSVSWPANHDIFLVGCLEPPVSLANTGRGYPSPAVAGTISAWSIVRVNVRIPLYAHHWPLPERALSEADMRAANVLNESSREGKSLVIRRIEEGMDALKAAKLAKRKSLAGHSLKDSTPAFEVSKALRQAALRFQWSPLYITAVNERDNSVDNNSNILSIKSNGSAVPNLIRPINLYEEGVQDLDLERTFEASMQSGDSSLIERLSTQETSRIRLYELSDAERIVPGASVLSKPLLNHQSVANHSRLNPGNSSEWGLETMRFLLKYLDSDIKRRFFGIVDACGTGRRAENCSDETHVALQSLFQSALAMSIAGDATSEYYLHGKGRKESEVVRRSRVAVQIRSEGGSLSSPWDVSERYCVGVVELLAPPSIGSSMNAATEFADIMADEGVNGVDRTAGSLWIEWNGETQVRRLLAALVQLRLHNWKGIDVPLPLPDVNCGFSASVVSLWELWRSLSDNQMLEVSLKDVDAFKSILLSGGNANASASRNIVATGKPGMVSLASPLQLLVQAWSGEDYLSTDSVARLLVQARIDRRDILLRSLPWKIRKVSEERQATQAGRVIVWGPLLKDVDLSVPSIDVGGGAGGGKTENKLDWFAYDEDDEDDEGGLYDFSKDEDDDEVMIEDEFGKRRTLTMKEKKLRQAKRIEKEQKRQRIVQELFTNKQQQHQQSSQRIRMARFDLPSDPPSSPKADLNSNIQADVSSFIAQQQSLTYPIDPSLLVPFWPASLTPSGSAIPTDRSIWVLAKPQATHEQLSNGRFMITANKQFDLPETKTLTQAELMANIRSNESDSIDNKDDINMFSESLEAFELIVHVKDLLKFFRAMNTRSTPPVPAVNIPLLNSISKNPPKKSENNNTINNSSAQALTIFNLSPNRDSKLKFNLLNSSAANTSWTENSPPVSSVLKSAQALPQLQPPPPQTNTPSANINIDDRQDDNVGSGIRVNPLLMSSKVPKRSSEDIQDAQRKAAREQRKQERIAAGIEKDEQQNVLLGVDEKWAAKSRDDFERTDKIRSLIAASMQDRTLHLRLGHASKIAEEETFVADFWLRILARAVRNAPNDLREDIATYATLSSLANPIERVRLEEKIRTALRIFFSPLLPDNGVSFGKRGYTPTQATAPLEGKIMMHLRRMMEFASCTALTITTRQDLAALRERALSPSQPMDHEMIKDLKAALDPRVTFFLEALSHASGPPRFIEEWEKEVSVPSLSDELIDEEAAVAICKRTNVFARVLQRSMDVSNSLADVNKPKSILEKYAVSFAGSKLTRVIENVTAKAQATKNLCVNEVNRRVFCAQVNLLGRISFHNLCTNLIAANPSLASLHRDATRLATHSNALSTLSAAQGGSALDVPNPTLAIAPIALKQHDTLSVADEAIRFGDQELSTKADPDTIIFARTKSMIDRARSLHAPKGASVSREDILWRDAGRCWVMGSVPTMEIPCMVEIVPAEQVHTSVSAECAIASAVSKLSPVGAARCLRPNTTCTCCMENAQFSDFIGWERRGDAHLFRGPLSSNGSTDGWVPVSDVIKASGGLLASNWNLGALSLVRTIGRQLAGLLLVLHAHDVTARALRWSDVWIRLERNGHVSLRVLSLRYAAFAHDNSGIVLPSLAGSERSSLSPEFFFKSAMEASRSHAVDSWLWAALMFELLFGLPPPAFSLQAAEVLATNSFSEDSVREVDMSALDINRNDMEAQFNEKTQLAKDFLNTDTDPSNKIDKSKKITTGTILSTLTLRSASKMLGVSKRLGANNDPASAHYDSILAALPYTPFASLPPEKKLVLRSLMERLGSLPPPPRLDTSAVLLVAASLSFSGFAPPLPDRVASSYDVVQKLPPSAFAPQSLNHNSLDKTTDSASNSPTRSIPKIGSTIYSILEAAGLDAAALAAEDMSQVVTLPEGRILDLIAACMQSNPASRPSMSQIFSSTVLDLDTMGSDQDVHEAIGKTTAGLAAGLPNQITMMSPFRDAHEYAESRVFANVNVRSVVSGNISAHYALDATDSAGDMLALTRARRRDTHPLAISPPGTQPERSRAIWDLSPSPLVFPDRGQQASHVPPAGGLMLYRAPSVDFAMVDSLGVLLAGACLRRLPSLEVRMRMLAAWAISQNPTTTAPPPDIVDGYLRGLAELETISRSHKALPSIMQSNVIRLARFVAFRAQETRPELLQAFAKALFTVGRVAAVPGLCDLSSVHDFYLLLCESVCGMEGSGFGTPVDSATFNFLRTPLAASRSAPSGPSSGVTVSSRTDLLDSLWRWYGHERRHFSKAVYKQIMPCMIELCGAAAGASSSDVDGVSGVRLLAEEMRDGQTGLSRSNSKGNFVLQGGGDSAHISGIADVARTRSVRGVRYLSILMQSANCIASLMENPSRLGLRAAVSLFVSVLNTNDLDAFRALDDIRLPLWVQHALLADVVGALPNQYHDQQADAALFIANATGNQESQGVSSSNGSSSKTGRLSTRKNDEALRIDAAEAFLLLENKLRAARDENNQALLAMPSMMAHRSPGLIAILSRTLWSPTSASSRLRITCAQLLLTIASRTNAFPRESFMSAANFLLETYSRPVGHHLRIMSRRAVSGNDVSQVEEDEIVNLFRESLKDPSPGLVTSLQSAARSALGGAIAFVSSTAYGETSANADSNENKQQHAKTISTIIAPNTISLFKVLRLDLPLSSSASSAISDTVTILKQPRTLSDVASFAEAFMNSTECSAGFEALRAPNRYRGSSPRRLGQNEQTNLDIGWIGAVGLIGWFKSLSSSSISLSRGANIRGAMTSLSSSEKQKIMDSAHSESSSKFYGKVKSLTALTKILQEAIIQSTYLAPRMILVAAAAKHIQELTAARGEDEGDIRQNKIFADPSSSGKLANQPRTESHSPNTRNSPLRGRLQRSTRTDDDKSLTIRGRSTFGRTNRFGPVFGGGGTVKEGPSPSVGRLPSAAAARRENSTGATKRRRENGLRTDTSATNGVDKGDQAALMLEDSVAGERLTYVRKFLNLIQDSYISSIASFAASAISRLNSPSAGSTIGASPSAQTSGAIATPGLLLHFQRTPVGHLLHLFAPTCFLLSSLSDQAFIDTPWFIQALSSLSVLTSLPTLPSNLPPLRIASPDAHQQHTAGLGLLPLTSPFVWAVKAPASRGAVLQLLQTLDICNTWYKFLCGGAHCPSATEVPSALQSFCSAPGFPFPKVFAMCLTELFNKDRVASRRPSFLRRLVRLLRRIWANVLHAAQLSNNLGVPLFRALKTIRYHESIDEANGQQVNLVGAHPSSILKNQAADIDAILPDEPLTHRTAHSGSNPPTARLREENGGVPQSARTQNVLANGGGHEIPGVNIAALRGAGLVPNLQMDGAQLVLLLMLERGVLDVIIARCLDRVPSLSLSSNGAADWNGFVKREKSFELQSVSVSSNSESGQSNLTSGLIALEFLEDLGRYFFSGTLSSNESAGNPVTLGVKITAVLHRYDAIHVLGRWLKCASSDNHSHSGTSNSEYGRALRILKVLKLIDVSGVRNIVHEIESQTEDMSHTF